MSLNTTEFQNIPEFDGVLEDWEVRGPCVFGRLVYDKKGRFTPNSQIRTSSVKRVEGVLLYTRNSVYVLGHKLNQPS